VTLTLALGVQRMAKRHAIARRLSAVEALGSVTVIATDKTGTLTENRMSVSSLESPDRQQALQAMVVANDAELDSAAGDPLEVALLEYANAQGADVGAIRRRSQRSSERPFDSEWKFMRVTLADDEVSYLKGAPEVLLERSRLSDGERADWLQRADASAARGHKVLALARGHGTDESSLEFLGLAMLWDPPRPEVADAIRTARSAGIRIVMITGDHPATARAIAEAIGIGSPRLMTGADLERLDSGAQQEAVQSVDVFARITPEDKLKIVERLKAAGEIVAVTGDGVNDAPALKRSDVGVAMGQRGSAVAREVADLVLVDDNFASIVAAIEEGRTIFANIEKFIRYTFSTNVALIVLMVFGAVTSYVYQLRDAEGMLLLPLSAAQLLWINFIGDGPPALALALDRNRDVMLRPPRHPAQALLAGAPVRFILTTGAIKGVVGVALLWLFAAAGVGMLVIRAAVFLYESIAKLVSVYPARRAANAPPQHNAALHISVILGVGLQLATVLVPGLRRLLEIEMPQLPAFGVVAGAIGLTAILIEITSWRIRRGDTARVARANEATSSTA
jgi:Ca2+-transporting ATPase